MALTMVHLLVADRWAQGHPECAESPEFFLGAVSPDAIHIRDHDDKSHKDEIHLFNWQSLHRGPVVDYWKAHRTAFDIGYGVHVLTDCQWVPRYKERLPGLLQPDGRPIISIYYNDNFVTDFALFRKMPRLHHILDLLERADVPEDHPLLTRYEFAEWRRVILEAYRGECPKHDSVRFIDEDYVLAFVEDSVALIDEVYAEAFGAGATCPG